jgi:hypothetical protein
LVFSGITIISKKKALKSIKTKVVEKTTIFIDNGNAETNMPLQRYHFRLGQSEKIVILKTKKNMSNKTHYMEACMTKGISTASQFLMVPLGTTNAGTYPSSAASSTIALINPAL